MDIEVDTDELRIAENNLYKDSDAFQQELNVWVQEIVKLKNVWTGEDADIFYNKIEEYIMKLRMVSETEKTFGKVLNTSYKTYEEQDQAFTLEIKKDRDQYDDEAFLKESGSAYQKVYSESEMNNVGDFAFTSNVYEEEFTKTGSSVEPMISLVSSDDFVVDHVSSNNDTLTYVDAYDKAPVSTESEVYDVYDDAQVLEGEFDLNNPPIKDRKTKEKTLEVQYVRDPYLTDIKDEDGFYVKNGAFSGQVLDKEGSFAEVISDEDSDENKLITAYEDRLKVVDNG